jgi:uncharacterized protein YndB with AHSA1/START domain
MLTRKRLLYLVAGMAIVLVGGSFLLPAQAVVERSTTIAAPPEKVFAIVGDLRRFHEFWPNAERDPNIRYSYQGTESGLGQKLVWTSTDPEIGNGVETITAYQPPLRVEFRSMAARRERAVTSFELAPATGGTDVTWTFTTDLAGVPARWSGLLFDGRIGADFDRGLARLKALAETAAPDPPIPEQAVLEQPAGE